MPDSADYDGKPWPEPCPEYPNCGDDEGPCFACAEYERHLEAGDDLG